MLCENKFCIYQENCECILDEIEVGMGGICNSCIVADVNESLLTELKSKTLNQLEDSY